MEEKKTNKMTYEELEKVAMQLQQKIVMAEAKLRQIDFASMRLTWLFKVIENSASFNKQFINNCSKEIEELLTIEEESPEGISKGKVKQD